MRSGFPLRLHYRLELWRARSGWFDQFINQWSWDAVARHDPLADDFVLIRTGGSVTRYSAPDELEHALEIPYKVNLKPPPKGSGRFYFLCRLEVTTLNDTDLEELTRWLKADVSREIRSEPGFAHAGAAPGAMVRLEAGEQRAVPEVLGTVAVAVQPVEHRGSGAGRSIGLRGAGGVEHHARRQHALGGDTGARIGMHRTHPARRVTGYEHSEHGRACRGRDDPGDGPAHSASSRASTSLP